MVELKDFISWIRTIQKEGLQTVRGKPYSLSLCEDERKLVFYIRSNTSERSIGFRSIKALLQRYKADRDKFISHYKYKKDNPDYTMSASYIIPLIIRFFDER